MSTSTIPQILLSILDALVQILFAIIHFWIIVFNAFLELINLLLHHI